MAVEPDTRLRPTRVGSLPTMEDQIVDQKYFRARVIHRSDDGRRVIVSYPNGHTPELVSHDEPFEVEVGNFALVSPDEDRIHAYPDDEVEETPIHIGVIREVLDESGEVLIEEDGRPVLVAHDSGPTVAVGNTVQFHPKNGVSRILSQEPFRVIDLSRERPPDVSTFRIQDPGMASELPPLGGLEKVVARARDLVILPLAEAKRFKAIGAGRRGGVLLTGPPGTGKTLLARHLAKEAGAALYLINGPEIVGKWLGESESVLRAIFEDASSQEKSIIMIDEIDSVAPRRDGDVHEASQRLVAQLLTLMDGFEKRPNIVVIATTNRAEAIDSALLRPGRLDGRIDFGDLSEAERGHILTVTADRLKHEADLPFELIAAATDGWSGAELVSIWDEAALLTVQDDRDEISGEDLLGGLQRVTLDRTRVAGEAQR